LVNIHQRLAESLSCTLQTFINPNEARVREYKTFQTYQVRVDALNEQSLYSNNTEVRHDAN
jgi:hypothetical protein